ncbi:MAG: VOC family protein [Terriglobales bacterium]
MKCSRIVLGFGFGGGTALLPRRVSSDPTGGKRELTSISVIERRDANAGTQPRYVIKFVADMGRAVKFHRDVLGLRLKFESPGWSEFVTGETTLALHPASEKNPAGKVELGFTVADVKAF